MIDLLMLMVVIIGSILAVLIVGCIAVFIYHFGDLVEYAVENRNDSNKKEVSGEKD